MDLYVKRKTLDKCKTTMTLKKNCIRDDYIKLIGKCSQCGADFVITSQDKTDKIISFLCEVRNIDSSCAHNSNIKSKLVNLIGSKCKFKRELNREFPTGDDKFHLN